MRAIRQVGSLQPRHTNPPKIESRRIRLLRRQNSFTTFTMFTTFRTSFEQFVNIGS